MTEVIKEQVDAPNPTKESVPERVGKRILDVIKNVGRKMVSLIPFVVIGDKKKAESSGAKEAPKTADAKPSDPSKPADKHESKEKVSSLVLTMGDVCKNPAGNYVGLNFDQRKALSVDIGDTVVLKNSESHEVIGLFFIAKHKPEFENEKEKFTTTRKDLVGKKIEVAKSNPAEETSVKADVSYEAENDEKNADRVTKIKERFGAKNFDGETYITVPTAVANIMKLEAPDAKHKVTKGLISLGKVKMGDKVTEIPIVPSGTGIGLTTKAVSALGIDKDKVKKATYKVNKEGILVIEKTE